MTQHKGWLLLAGALFALAPLSIDMYLPAFPALAREFGGASNAVPFTLTAFFAGLAIGQLFYGPISDRYGRKAPLLFGLMLYTLSSAACALAVNLSWLAFFRLFQALGGCAALVIIRAMVRDQFDQQSSARIFSKLMLVMGVAPMLAPLLGGYLQLVLGWRAIFWFLSCYGLGATLIAFWRLEESHSGNSQAPLHPGEIIKNYIGLMKLRQFSAYALGSSIAISGMFAYIAGSPYVLIQLYDVPAQYYGWLFGLNAMGLIGAAQINARLLKTIDASRILHVADRAGMIMALLILIAALTHAPLLLLLLPLWGYLVSLGFVQPNAMAGAMAQQSYQAGTASAMLGTLQYGMAMLAGNCVAWLFNGAAWPFAAIIFACASGAVIVRRTLLPKS